MVFSALAALCNLGFLGLSFDCFFVVWSADVSTCSKDFDVEGSSEAIVAVGVDTDARVEGFDCVSIGFSAERSKRWCKRAALLRLVCFVNFEQWVHVSTLWPSPRHNRQQAWPSVIEILP